VAKERQMSTMLFLRMGHGLVCFLIGSVTGAEYLSVCPAVDLFGFVELQSEQA